MSNIAEVIGWKFNHQPGMSTKGGEIVAFPGGIPSKADQDRWTAEYEAYLASLPPPGPDPLEELRTALKADPGLLIRIKGLK